MTDERHVPHVPTLAGGFGYDEVQSFYKNNFVGKIPKDIKIKPTVKYVEIPHVVIMKFDGSKIAHEHIYWDQA